ncbi:MAG: magnesium transporter [Thermotoga sp.]|jgi:magnesium transporter|uniref:Magnesium transport protein CorA n=2 Tax=Thermotogaceae TaxID=188709 RepID=B9KB86_THENN|nr:Magnesium transport protein corA [Thermotoga neapolitana DSM 4359]MDK2786263.1 magnesium transporter [Thermotoga sp.]MDK2949718.1 magnesium transporter [Thermotoga sp.]
MNKEKGGIVMEDRVLSIKKGLPPGTLVYTGKYREDFEIEVMSYSPEEFREFRTTNVEDVLSLRDSSMTTWINIVGVHRTDVVERIGEHFGIHLLVLEDILNINQRPKIEFFDEYVFLVLKMITYDENSSELTSEQISLILRGNCVLTFQEKRGDVFDPVRERIRHNRGVIRKRGADYLLYALVDALVDNYFVLLEKIDDETEILEEEVLEMSAEDTVQKIYVLKRNLIELRKTIWPLREVLNEISRGESSLIKEETLPYFKDVYDHTIRIADTVETFRDIASGLLDVYLSNMSNRTNEVMKVLTIIATIFMPLTFIAGIYGMNFEYMPELSWKWGYPVVLIVMGVIAFLMVVYFRKKKWL